MAKRWSGVRILASTLALAGGTTASLRLPAHSGMAHIRPMLRPSTFRSPASLLLIVGVGLACSAPDYTGSSSPEQDPSAGSSPTIEAYDSRAVLPEGLPFSEAVRVDNTLYLSGQVGVLPGSLELVDGGLPAEARQTMENIAATLAEHGYSMSDVVKCTVMLTDMSRWGEFNGIYVTYFSAPYPARSAIGASGLALGAAVEVECIAAREAGAP